MEERHSATSIELKKLKNIFQLKIANLSFLNIKDHTLGKKNTAKNCGTT